MTKLTKSKLLVEASLLITGSGLFAASWVRGEHRRAFEGLGLILFIALALLLATRSESLRRRIFDTDERYDAIGLFAGMWAGFTTFGVLFVIFLVEFARGHSGEPYYWLSGSYVALFILFGIARSVRR